MAANKTHITLAFLLILALAKLAILFWSVDKGLEMTDEGYYLLWFKSAHLYPPDMHLNYYYLVQTFFSWVHWDITAMRIGGIITELGAALALAWGTSKYLKAEIPSLYSTSMVATLVVGGISALFMAEHARSLSYDSLTHLLMGIGGGLCLWWVAAKKPLTPLQAFAFGLGLGLVLAAQFVVKFSSTVLLGGLFGGLCLLLGRRGNPQVPLFMGLVVGTGLVFGGIFASQLSPASFLDYFQTSYQRISQLGYSPLDIVLHTYLAKDVVHLTINLGAALTAFGLGLWAWRNRLAYVRVGMALLSGSIIFIVQQWVAPTNYFPQWHFRIVDVLLYLIITGIAVLMLYKRGNIKLYLAMGVLFAVPFVCAIGSAKNLSLSLVSYLPAWVMLVLVLWSYIHEQIQVGYLQPFIRYGVILLCTSIFLSVFIWPSYLPHGMAAPMHHQAISPVTHDRVKLDPPTAKFVADTKLVLANHGFAPGGYILALYDLPGLVYLLEGYSPEVLWYFGETTRATTEEAVDNTCWHIGNITNPNVFVVKPVTIHPDVTKCLSFSKLNFPASYNMAGTVYNTYCKCEMEVWAPKQ